MLICDKPIDEGCGDVSLHLVSFSLLLPSRSFGVTKKAKAGRLGVGDRPLFFPKSKWLARLAEERNHELHE